MMRCRLLAARCATTAILVLLVHGSCCASPNSVGIPQTAASASVAPPDLLSPPVDKPLHGGLTPSLSPDGKTICFSYKGNLWTVPTSGGLAARLTVHEGFD